MKTIILSLLCVSYLSANDINTQAPSKELQQLLSTEMSYIKSGMDEILYGIISGDYAQISKVASKIQHSYILKDSITPAQKAEMRKTFSQKFMEYDMEFHESAQDLANFADFDDKKNVLQTYTSMVNQCVRCHETFATFRFKKEK